MHPSSHKIKYISLLGATGSIGSNVLKIISSSPQRFKLVGMSAGRNLPLFKKQIKKFSPIVVSVATEALAKKLKNEIPSQIKVFFGEEGLKRVATLNKADLVVSSLVGSIGLKPTYQAIEAQKDIALANKEVLVIGGHLITKEAKKRGVCLLPLDSEHSAIFQSLMGNQRSQLRRVILTASGGPFWNKKTPPEQITLNQALRHPNWKMGSKITIDSATLLNKGLEAIEARWLFGLKGEQIDILIHPQSIVHSLVEYIDGTLIGLLSIPDMKIPISYALHYPQRVKLHLPRLNLVKLQKLNFFKPDLTKFPLLKLALDCLADEKKAIVLNAANEVAVSNFIQQKISFIKLIHLVKETVKICLPQLNNFSIKSIDAILKIDGWAKEFCQKLINQER